VAVTQLMSRSALTRPTATGQRKGAVPPSVLPSQQHSYELYAAGGYPTAAPVPDGVVVGYPYYSYPGVTASVNETNTGVVGQTSAAAAMTPEAYYYAQYYQQAAAIAAAAGALADPSGQQLVLNANAAAATRAEEEVGTSSLSPPSSSFILVFREIQKKSCQFMATPLLMELTHFCTTTSSSLITSRRYIN
jgi:hypothetical protein